MSVADQATLENIKTIFRTADENKDGFITRDELKTVFGQCAEWTDEQFDAFYNLCDPSGDGRISYEEFVDWLLGSEGAVDQVNDGEQGAQKYRLHDIEIEGIKVPTWANGIYTRQEVGVEGHGMWKKEFSDGSGLHLWRGKTGKKAQWVITRAPPAEDGVTTRFLFRNPDKKAMVPIDCGSLWISRKGKPLPNMLVSEMDQEEEEDGEEGESGSDEDSDDQGDEDFESDGHSSACDSEMDSEVEDPEEEPEEGEIVEEEEPEEAPEPFEDADFPAVQESIGKTEGDTAGGLVADAATSWVRLSQVEGHRGDPVILFGTVSPGDIMQGMLGNCWFLAACSSIASYPGWVKRIFGNPEEGDPTKDCKYAVTLFHPGQKKYLHLPVSDEVPGDGRPQYSQLSEENEIWVCLAEKAFAKLCSAYAPTEGGLPSYGMYYLTGGRGESWFPHNGKWYRRVADWKGPADADKISRPGDEGWAYPNGNEEDEAGISGYGGISSDQLWTALLQYMAHQYCMACGISQPQDEMYGLIAGHAYSLIGLRVVTTSKGKRVRLVKVRNPHGATEWLGRWSDKPNPDAQPKPWKGWDAHPKVKKSLKFTPKNDGTFYMSWKDFLTYFAIIDIAKKKMPIQGCHRDHLLAIKAAREQVAALKANRG